MHTSCRWHKEGSLRELREGSSQGGEVGGYISCKEGVGYWRGGRASHRRASGGVSEGDFLRGWGTGDLVEEGLHTSLVKREEGTG